MGRGYLPPRPFLFGGWGQLPLGGGFLSPLPAFCPQLPGRTGESGFGPRFRGGFPFCLTPIAPPSWIPRNVATSATPGKLAPEDNTKVDHPRLAAVARRRAPIVLTADVATRS